MKKINRKGDSRKVVIARELEWHELEAERRYSLDAFLYGPPAFDRLVQSSLDFLQISPGDVVLDLGCGEGKETLGLIQQDLIVIGMDLSYQQLIRSRERVQASGLNARVCFVQANAEDLPFASDSFSLIYGKAVLHHLDVEHSAQEIKRILRQEGRASFAEPMAYHPLFWLGRHLSPHLRTKDEHPLSFKDLRHFCMIFSHSEMEEHFLFSPLCYIFRLIPGGEAIFRSLHLLVQRVDWRLFHIFPLFKEIAWYGLIKIER